MFCSTGRRFLTALFAAAFAAGAASCGSPADDHQSEEPLKIGTLLSLTGDLAAYGPPIQAGAALAARFVNEAGGVIGTTVEIVGRDSQTDPTAAVDTAQKMVSIDRVPAFVGALSSGVTIPVATAVSVPNKVVQISPASTSPEITLLDDGDFLFRTVPTDALQCIVLAKVAREQGYGKTAVIYVNNPYGEGLARSYREAFEAGGGTVTDAVPFNKGQASYRSEVQRAVAGAPEALVVMAYPENGVKILRQAIETGMANRFVLPDGMKAPEVIESIGAEYLEGTWGTAPSPVATHLTERFTAAYEESFGEKPPKPYIDTAFDATVLIALAAAKAGSHDGTAIRNALRAVANPPGSQVDFTDLRRAFDLIKTGTDIDYVGVSGPVDFDAQGDVTSGTYGVWKIEDGKIVEVRVEVLQ